MSKGTPLGSLVGEKIVVNVHISSEDEAAALCYPLDYDGLPVRCALTISNYRIMIRPAGDNSIGANENDLSLSLPLLSIESWGVPRRKMTDSCRAAFWWSGKKSVADTDATQCSADELSLPPPPLAQSSFQSVVYSLKISTKHLWEVELLLHGERLTHTVTQLYLSNPIKDITHIKLMPAFDLYKERYHARREEDMNNMNNNNNGSIADGMDVSANLFDHVEFGWNLYDANREMQRQLCIDPRRVVPSVNDVSNVGPMRDLRPWFRLTRVKQLSNSYGRSPTYPFHVVVPNAASDELLEDAMVARSHARFPAVSFVHLGSGAVLARSSQPLRKSPTLRQDGYLCYMLTNSGYHAHNAEPKRESSAAACAMPTGGRAAPPPSLFDTDQDDMPAEWFSANTQQATPPPPRHPRRLLVADCRPRGAAYAHYGMGAGYESGTTHDFCEVKFHGIENVHSVSDSFAKLKALVHQFNGKQPRDNFFKQLHDTNWLQHVQRILMCSNDIAEALDRGDSCLVHCTDGWDRTPQCTATAMLLLDPFYRTIVGFSVLVEKEFCSFGHKFAERCGHQVRGDTGYSSEAGVPGSDADGQSSSSSVKLQPAPIFLQWMDVVFQVVRQFPEHFEFTTQLLEHLSEEVYSCLHGTFLCNGEKERMFEGVRLGTASIWTDMVRAAAKERSGEVPLYFVNDAYDSATAWQYISKQEGSGIYRLSPNCSSKRVVLWESFYLRHDGDNYSINLNRSLGIKKQVVFHKEWERYFDQLVNDSCVARRREVAEMRRELEGLMVKRSIVAVSNASQVRSDPRTCHQCRQKLGIFSSREKCCGCGVVMCGSCAISPDGEMKMCRECHKRYEWNIQ